MLLIAGMAQGATMTPFVDIHGVLVIAYYQADESDLLGLSGVREVHWYNGQRVSKEHLHSRLTGMWDSTEISVSKGLWTIGGMSGHAMIIPRVHSQYPMYVRLSNIPPGYALWHRPDGEWETRRVSETGVLYEQAR